MNKKNNPYLFKKISLIFAGTIFGIVISVVILEIYLRLSNKMELQRSKSPSITDFMKMTSNKDFSEPMYRLSNDILIGWELNPEFKGTNCAGQNINSFGFFGNQYKLKKPKNVYRIIILGDSVTEHSWMPIMLEEELNRYSDKYEFEVWNCAVGAYNISHYYALTRNKILKYDPDMVIVNFCLNDIFLEQSVAIKLPDIGYVEYDNNFGIYPMKINPELFIKSYTYRALLNVVRKFILSKEELAILTDTDINSKANWAINKMTAKLKDKNIEFFASIVPYFQSLNKYSDRELNGYKELKNILIENKVSHVDLHGKFSNIDDPELRTDWLPDKSDYIHPSKKADKIIFKNIFAFIINNNLIKRNK